MNFRMRHLLVLVPVAGACLAYSTAVTAQPYPAKPIRILVGFAAGGSTDLVARIVAAKLHAAFGQPTVVENRSGAGGNIAAEQVAKSPPDGHTLLVTPSSFAVNPSLFKRTPYDAIKDFAPVSATCCFWCATHRCRCAR